MEANSRLEERQKMPGAKKVKIHRRESEIGSIDANKEDEIHLLARQSTATSISEIAYEVPDVCEYVFNCVLDFFSCRW